MNSGHYAWSTNAEVVGATNKIAPYHGRPMREVFMDMCVYVVCECTNNAKYLMADREGKKISVCSDRNLKIDPFPPTIISFPSRLNLIGS